MGWKTLGLLSLAAVGAGCGGGDGREARNQPVQQRARLEAFESCEALERYVEDTAVADMKRRLDAMKPREDSGGWWGPPVMVDSGGTAESAAGSDAPADYTTTNTQVAGVDESDFVKNDGTRIFVLSGQKLYVHQSWPANELSLKSSLAVEGYPREMLLDEKNRLVIFSTLYEPLWDLGRGAADGSPTAGDAAGCSPFECGYHSANATKVTTVNVEDSANPRVVNEVYLAGDFHNSRRIGASVRLVLQDSFRWPSMMRWNVNYEESLWSDPEKLSAAYDDLKVENEALLRAQPLEAWMPAGRRKAADGTVTPLPYRCEDFHRPTAATELGVVTVATLNLDAPDAEPARTTLVARAGEVYASTKSLYLATNHWWWHPEAGQEDFTYLHKFDLQEPHRAAYVASGGVRGTIVDQFSLDEHEDVLRVASTATKRLENDEGSSWRFETTNRVSTLGERAGRLELLGQSRELAAGERIYSARFLGDEGYVVTFRQVDPLFTFDLSDPAHPRQVGELKVPGFSTYIHPLEGGFLLTVGVHQPENGGWQERALKLSLFDVRDLAHPKEAFTQQVGTAFSWSEALYDHKAFNYFPAKKLLAIPFADWEPSAADFWGSFKSELRVYSVDTATGFTPRGALSMRDVYIQENYARWSWYWTPNVRRSVMADDFVYAITDAGVRSAHVESLGTPLATTHFRPVMIQPK